MRNADSLIKKWKKDKSFKKAYASLEKQYAPAMKRAKARRKSNG